MSGNVRKKAVDSTAPYAAGDILVFYAATFTKTPDAVGDVIEPTAFDQWLREFKASGRRLPIVWSHDWDSVSHIIGYADGDDITVDTKGLLIAAHIDMDNPKGARIMKLVREGVITECSFSFEVAPNGEYRDAQGVNHLTKISRVMEAGPCLIAANSDATVVGTRSAASADPVSRKAIAAMIDSIEESVRIGRYSYDNQINALAEKIRRKFGPGILSETGADPLVTQGEAPPPVAPVDYVGQRQARCPQCQRWQTYELSRVAASPVAFGVSPCCGAILGWGPPLDEKSYRAEVARWKSEHMIVEEVWDPEAERWLRWKVLEDTDLDDDDKADDDRAETLFDLSDRDHALIATRIVFDENGHVRDRWTWRGQEVGADLTPSERQRVIERVRRAAERFGIDLTYEKATPRPPFRNREAATIGRSMARRDQRAEAKRLQRQAQVELLQIEADLAALEERRPPRKAVNMDLYRALDGIGAPMVEGRDAL